jgi:hypothetical protein
MTVPKIVRILIGIFALVGIAYAAFVAFFLTANIHHTVCIVYPVMEVSSPDSAYRATVENSTCDQSGLQTKVWLSGDRKSLAGGASSSVFVAPSARAVGAGTYAPLQLRLTWLDGDHLQIRYPLGTKVDSRVEHVDGIRISFVETDSFAP